jgi:hypothetical protein
MNLGHTVLGKINPSKQDKYMIPLIWSTKSSQIQRQKLEGWLPGVRVEENRELERWKVLKTDGANRYTTV